jgi:hypothetical protein
LLTTTTVRNAIGTVISAGWLNTLGAQLPVNPLTVFTTSAVNTSPPPTTMPAAAPTQVSLRHQTPSSRTGQNVDAASANDMPTDSEMSDGRSTIASASGTPPAMAVANRKSRTRPRSTSVDSTPDTLTTSPDEVDRNAANAPAVSTAPSTSPSTPGAIFVGSASTAPSVPPVTSSSGTYSRDSAPMRTGNR